MIDTPEKLIIEPTTRCNFNCRMCVKQSSGCEIAEGDLSRTLFSACDPLLPHLNTIIFTGIGEPLLNNDLELFALNAREKMKKSSIIGFQTNGKLMTHDRAISLVRSGINKICISIDTVKPRLFDAVRTGGQLSDIELAFHALLKAKHNISDTDLSLGIEFVLMKKNMDELPLVIEWAAKKQIDFVIVTHVTAYEKETENQTAYLNNSHEAMAMFEKYREKAIKRNLDITQYNKILWKFYKSDKDVEIYKLIAALKDEALGKDLYLNLYHLLQETLQGSEQYNRIKAVFDQARQKAAENGITLTLPQIRPKTNRKCQFIEENTVFVTWDGLISPCYFLWHKYETMRNGYIKQVTPQYFGKVNESSILDIWNQEDYQSFRQKVMAYDYPNCHAWCETRCDYVLDEPFYQDCFINDIPCCDCHWNLGLLNCLTA